MWVVLWVGVSGVTSENPRKRWRGRRDSEHPPPMKGRKLLILQYGRSCKNGPSAELGYTAGTRNRFAKFAFREKFHVSREVTFSRIASAHGAWSPDRAPWHHAERMYEARPMMGKSPMGVQGHRDSTDSCAHTE